MQIAVGTYSGNNDAGDGHDSITGVGFQPDFVLVTNDSTQYDVWRSSDMAGDLSGRASAAGALAANLIESLDVDGFSIGSDDGINDTGVEYYYTAIRDDGASDIHLGNYTGDGNDDRDIAAGDYTPEFAMIKHDAASFSHTVWKITDNAGEDTMYFHGTGDIATDNIQAFIANGFTVGQGQRVNTNNGEFYYMCLDEITLMDAGTYVGDGNDPRVPDVTGIGFDPDAVWIKQDGTWEALERNKEVAGDSTMYFVNKVDAANFIEALVTDGFQLGSAARVNANGSTYRYFCLKEGTTAAVGITLALKHALGQGVANKFNLLVAGTVAVAMKHAVQSQVTAKPALGVAGTIALVLKHAVQKVVAKKIVLSVAGAITLAMKHALQRGVAKKIILSVAGAITLSLKHAVQKYVAKKIILSVAGAVTLVIKHAIQRHVAKKIALTVTAAARVTLSIMSAIQRQVARKLSLTLKIRLVVKNAIQSIKSVLIAIRIRAFGRVPVKIFRSKATVYHFPAKGQTYYLETQSEDYTFTAKAA